MKPKFWSGEVPAKDAFGQPITEEFIDGKTIYGPWAIMSPKSFRERGLGLGLGRGQRYQRQSDNRWLKVEG